MILLVDDDAEQVELRRDILAASGYRAEAAFTPEQALALCGEPCRAVVMDLRLPELAGGLALIGGLHARSPQLPIFVLSGYPRDLEGRPERALVRAVLRKGSGTRALLDLLRSNSIIPQ